MKRQEITFDFPNQNGDILSGIIEMPIAKPIAFGIFIHCFTCSKDIHAASRISKFLAERNIAMLRFDLTGLGKSEGDFTYTSFSSNKSDIKHAYNAIKNAYQAPELLIGHSWGGTAALSVANELDTIKTIATIGSPKDPTHVMRHIQDNNDIVYEGDLMFVTIAGVRHKLSKEFFEDVKNHDLEQDIQKTSSKIITIQAPNDEMVHVQNAHDIIARASSRKLSNQQLIMLPEHSDHMVRKIEDAEMIAEKISKLHQ